MYEVIPSSSHRCTVVHTTMSYTLNIIYVTNTTLLLYLLFDNVKFRLFCEMFY